MLRVFFIQLILPYVAVLFRRRRAHESEFEEVAGVAGTVSSGDSGSGSRAPHEAGLMAYSAKHHEIPSCSHRISW